MKKPPGVSKQLVVEGYEDLYSVVGLMKGHISWSDDPTKAPVFIEIGKSIEEILEDGYLTTILKARDITELGVMLDADDKPSARYGRMRKLFLPAFPNLPETLPPEGLVADNGEKRIGIWIMPDNSSEGCLETFLRYLVPDHSEALWEHATQAVAIAKAKDAPFHECHSAKAVLYTWLAWQDPPGQHPGLALTKKVLNPHGKSGATFVSWFRRLYSL